jgi:hypothetical protein
MELVAIIYLFVVFMLIAWAADTIPFVKTAKHISDLSQSSLKTIQSEDLDDSAKQSVLLGNSLGIMKHSFLIILFTAVLILLLLLLLKLSVFISPLNFDYLSNYLINLSGIILSIAAFLFYFLLKKLYVRFRV